MALPASRLGWIYGAGIAAVALLLIYEHALVRPDDLTRVNAAFFNVNVVISVGLFVVGHRPAAWASPSVVMSVESARTRCNE